MFVRSLFSPPVGVAPPPLAVWRKRLIYHAGKRGMRENEMVLSAYAKRHIGAMSEDQCRQFDLILSQPDPDVNLWLTGKTPVPAEIDSDVWQDIVRMIAEGPGSLRSDTN